MKVERQEAWLGPSVGLCEVDRSGDASKPELRFLGRPPHALGPTDPPDLLIVGGAFKHAAPRAQAVQVARWQKDGALLLAVFEVEEEAALLHQVHLRELQAVFHAVIVVTTAQRQQVISRLIKTVSTVDGQEQWINCDWKDVCHFFRIRSLCPVRFGCARSTGVQRAAVATREAIVQANCQGTGLRTARGICVGIRVASRNLHGREVKEVMHQIRSRVSRDATITMSIGCDDALQDEVFDVDIFAFGEFTESELLRDGADSDHPGTNAGPSQDAVWKGEDASLDPLYAAARALVIRHQRASISLVQRHLRIGYGRASRLVEAMEGDVLSAKDEDGMRRVLGLDKVP